MLPSSGPATTQRNKAMWNSFLITLMLLETGIIITALVPANLWERILPASETVSLNGPYPARIAPLITALIYLTPTIIGLLCSTWQKAILLATLPAWIALGIFLIAATSKVGAFYLVSTDHVTANVSIIELFAALGGIGWLGRYLFKLS